MAVKRAIALAVVLLVIGGAVTWGWLRRAPDWTVALGEPEVTVTGDRMGGRPREGAEVVVVGHLVGDPVRVEHQRAPDDGRSWEFHAQLAIDEVLRGTLAQPQIPIILHYGLSPSRYLQDGKLVQGSRPTGSPGQTISDTRSFGSPGRPLLEDANQPAIWLLGHYADRFGRGNQPTEQLGVSEPEHLWPIKFLPFMRAILKPDALDEQLAFLHDPDVDIRRQCLRYFIDHQERRAFPAVAELLTDNDLASLAVEACQKCGGPAAIPHLRKLLADETQGTFCGAANALAALKDTDSVPRLVAAVESGRVPSARACAAQALGILGDVRAVPALLAALKGDQVLPGGRGEELWSCAQRSLRSLTGCTLSPNGDKAACWWAAAGGRDRTVWGHFGIAQGIEGLLIMGPDRQLRTNGELARLAGARPAGLHLDFMRPREYDPAKGQLTWREWLSAQRWTDYQDLPSQIDDELAVTAEPSTALASGEPVRLRYRLLNRSDRELRVTTSFYELLDVIYVSGNGFYGSEGEYSRPRESSTEDFFRLAPGESWTVVGRYTLANASGRAATQQPAIVAAALVFDRKGTSLGLDAWVGEVWTTPMRLGGMGPRP